MKLAFGMPHSVELKAIMQPWELAVTGADQVRLAKLADELGFEMISTPEHFLVPTPHVELSGPHYFHSTSAQSFYAGATERILVNSCVTLLPLQNPVITAKSLATLDWLSGGRAVVTFGVGWLAEEFEVFGVPFKERGAIADEYVAAIIELWTSDSPTFEGKYISFKDVAFAPKPVRDPHVPIWFGGDADPALKRAARFGSGWWPFLTKPESIASRIDFIKQQPTYDGRPFDVMYSIGTSRVGEHHEVMEPDAKYEFSAEELVDKLGELESWGVTYSGVPTPPLRSIEAYEDFVRWVAEEVKPKLG